MPRRPTALDASHFYPVWTHPDVLYWSKTWKIIRDCLLGEQEIKSKSTEYLSPLDEMDDGEYASYLERAVFYNMTARTLSALTGIVFQRAPKVTGVADVHKAAFRAPTRSGVTFDAFLKETVAEVITTGRQGVLLDMDKEGKQAPFFCGYTAENIIDWTEQEIEGRLVPTEIVLREFAEKQRVFGSKREYNVIYRALRLEWNGSRQRWEYHQDVYVTNDVHADLTRVEPTRITPTRRGVPFNRIPFRFFGAVSNTTSVDRSPLADIARLNLAHYRSYAQLEHGRFYTAMPIYYAQTPAGDGTADYRIGSSVVWECGVGEKPGVIEFNGQGLQFLENACMDKEEQIASLGGRLMGGRARSVSESDNQARIKEGNERSVLLNVVMGVNEGMSELLRLWLWWREDPAWDDAEVELSTQFLMDTLGARELRAIYAMYKDGAVPVTVLHHYLRLAEAVPDWMGVDEFKALLDDEDEFPNQPDVLAKMRGFNTNKERLDKNAKARSLRVEERLATVEEQKVRDSAALH
jgi:hypothetical protein